MWKTGLLLLFWGLLTSSELQQEETEPERRSQPRSGKLDFGYVPQGVYQTLAYYEPGVIGILFHMVHAFLYVVQPNPFPEDLVIKVAKDKFGAIQSEYQKPENIVLTLQAIYYETGFMVCAVLGLLFMVLLPLVGLFFCLCRCCDNCGGEMHQRQRKNADCQRGLLTTLLFATSLVITAGVLCAYAANQNLSSQLKGMRRLVSSNLRDLQSFTNETPTQIDYLIAQYATAKNKVLSDLDNVGPLLGGKIHEELGKEVRPALDGALSMAVVKVERAIKAMRETKEALENVSVSLEVLQEATWKLHFNLSLVRSSLNKTLNDPGCSDEDSDATTAQLCRSIRSSLAQLHVSANFTRLPDVNNQLESVNQLLKTDLSNIIQKGYSSFNDTPGMVSDQMRNVVEGARRMLDIIGTNISSFSKVFPVHSTMANFTNFISHTHSKIEDSYPEIDQIDFYRWICCIGLCCMVVLILAFNFLAILCGSIGYDKHASPTTRGCVSNTGGTLLMAGVGFSFLFSWILMGVVTATFLVGGNVEKLVCEPFHTKQLFKVLDTPHLVNPEWRNFIPGYMYNDSDLDLTVESLYSNCKENRGIYSAMRLDKVFNVTTFLNSSLDTKEVGKMFNNVKIDLRAIILLESEGKQNLIGFSETGVAEINYVAYLEEVNKGVTQVDLLSYANELEAQTDLMPKGPLQTSLKGHANSLRQIHSQQVIPMEQAMKYVRARSMLNQSIRLLERTASDLPNKVTDVLATIEAAQYLISQNATQVVNQETEKYKQTIVGYFRQYIEWVRTSLTMEVAACKPFSNIVDTVEIIACSFLVDSLNTFWFGLGCCALFLLPSIILSVKLAKFYRRMDTEDVYDDIITIPMKTIPAYDTMSRFPRASAPPRHIDW
ncbi:prominin-1-A isoform X5 [Coregonus clupeaformis]|uniref:prominin-1-A isoform X5 n=2 Tax=Coregonus clupeaformis TaxID=59861 RepID=UPI001BE02C0B|nr:prominin-1-A isoform X5 [Coregonus clupeaformis]XP_041698348.1 prominin-1-A isoform X5 [Coregonus clupeaformis]XP_045061270.1 prominin-1-A isoform X5 [Coregonus clupeaformis]XP_045061274.1 prominin-1-A isoform X5 [Coregonus clupeaformis]